MQPSEVDLSSATDEALDLAIWTRWAKSTATSLFRELQQARTQRQNLAPGPAGLPMLGSLGDFAWGDPLSFLLRATSEYGDVVRMKFGPFPFYLINHPDHIRHVLQENVHKYPKSLNYDELRPVVGNGLLTSSGDFWLRQRRLAQPGFHRARLAALTEVMAEITDELLQRWETFGSQPFDLAEEMTQLTLRIAARTLFSQELGEAGTAISEAVRVMSHHVNERTAALVRLPGSLPLPANLRAKRMVRRLDEVVYGILRERRAAPPRDASQGDLLDMLLAARDEKTGEGMDDKQLRDEVMTLLLAGHETTASTLAWTFYLLPSHPSVMRTARAEAQRVLGTRRAHFEDLANLPYTLQVIHESMRLFPPAWMMERTALEDDELGGYHIPAGSLVVVSPFTVHRHPRYWPNPEGFDPERFSPEASAMRPRFAFMPFSGGPRQCIGNHFALLEAQLIVAMVLQRFDVHLLPGHKVEPEPLVTLRPKHGVQVRLAPAPKPSMGRVSERPPAM